MLRSVRLFATPWTIASEAPLSMGLPRQQCKSRWLQKEPEDEGRCCSVDKSCLTLCSPWTAACQASLSLNISRSLPKFMSTESVMPSNHLILCYPLLLLPSIFPSITPTPWSFFFFLSIRKVPLE